MKSCILLIPILCLVLSSCDEGDDKEIQYYNPEQSAQLNLPFSAAVIVDDMIYLSGSIGTVPGTKNLVEGGIRAEARQTMENIKSVLEANGASMNDIIKCTVMINDISQWDTFNEEYVKFFPGNKPARSAFGADGLALGAAVEVECIACLDDD